jgi:hypothetical protein
LLSDYKIQTQGKIDEYKQARIKKPLILY